MTLKDELGYYLDNILDRIDDIANEDIKLVAMIGVTRVVTDFLEALRTTHNVYKDDRNGK